MNVFRFVLFKQCNVYFCVSRGKNWIFLQALQIIRTKLCQRQRPMILNYFLKEYYLHSPYQTLREASYYLNLHFFPLFNYSYDVGRSMMIKGMQFVHVQGNILIYTTSLSSMSVNCAVKHTFTQIEILQVSSSLLWYYKHCIFLLS